ncbi:MAG: NACHT domain-containing protein [Euryarchaeota archaeon]|nr:NACHT domain-containing protein [Euryarchaeota archaeon]
MLELVKNSWVKGVLEQSLQEEVLIELDLEERRDAILNRQGIELQRPGKPNRMLQPGTNVLQPGTKIVDVFDEMGKTLIILGEPGSGKTTLLLELAHDTIARAEEDPKLPIPVVFNLSSWTDTKQPIAKWLMCELNTMCGVPKGIINDWIPRNELLLLLDGLDEVSPKRREACIHAINDFRQKHGQIPLAVCCHTADYEAMTTRLDIEIAVSPQPLAKEQVDSYLNRMGPELAALRATLKDDPELYQLAQSPLVLSIMTLAYREMSVHDLQPLETVDARRKHIFDNYVERVLQPRIYRTVGGNPETSFTSDRKQVDSRFSKEKTIHRLSWLAKRMSQRRQTVFQIEHVQPDWLPTHTQQRIMTIGVVVMTWLLTGMPFVLLFGVHGLWMGVWYGLLFGMIGGQGIELEYEGIFDEPGSREVGKRVEGTKLTRTVPNEGIHRSARNALVSGLFAGLLFGLLSVPVAWLMELHDVLFVALIVGLLNGLLSGLHFGGLACIQHYVLRIMLRLNGSAPLRYVRFLDYAAGHIFLRKVGGGYIFVHRLLLEYFASLELEEEGG